MKRFASDRVAGLMERMGLEGDVAIESRLVSKTIENAQSRVEGYNFDIRKRVVEYDDVINKQRETIYAERDKVLNNEDLGEHRPGLRRGRDRRARRAAPGPGHGRLGPRRARARRSPSLGLTGEGIDADALERAGRPGSDRGRASSRRPRPTLAERRAALRRARPGRWSSAWSCCAPSTSCGWTT